MTGGISKRDTELWYFYKKRTDYADPGNELLFNNFFLLRACFVLQSDLR